MAHFYTSIINKGHVVITYDLHLNMCIIIYIMQTEAQYSNKKTIDSDRQSKIWTHNPLSWTCKDPSLVVLQCLRSSLIDIGRRYVSQLLLGGVSFRDVADLKRQRVCKNRRCDCLNDALHTLNVRANWSWACVVGKINLQKKLIIRFTRTFKFSGHNSCRWTLSDHNHTIFQFYYHVIICFF